GPREVARAPLPKRTAVAKQAGKALRARQPRAESHGPVDRLLGHRPRLTLHVRFCSCASPWRGWNHCAAADACPAPAEQSVAHSCRAATRCRTGNGPRKDIFVVQKWDTRRKKSRRSRRLEV